MLNKFILIIFLFTSLFTTGQKVDSITRDYPTKIPFDKVAVLKVLKNQIIDSTFQLDSITLQKTTLPIDITFLGEFRTVKGETYKLIDYVLYENKRGPFDYIIFRKLLVYNKKNIPIGFYEIQMADIIIRLSTDGLITLKTHPYWYDCAPFITTIDLKQNFPIELSWTCKFWDNEFQNCHVLPFFSMNK